MDWIQLSWIELNWFGLNRIELSWIELMWNELKSVDLYWVVLKRIELSSNELIWIRLSWMSWVDSRCQGMHIKKEFHCMHEASMIAHLACTKWSSGNLLLASFEKVWYTSFMWKIFWLKATWQAMYFPPTQHWPCEEKYCWIAARANYTEVRKQNKNELLQKATVPPRTQHSPPRNHITRQEPSYTQEPQTFKRHPTRFWELGFVVAVRKHNRLRFSWDGPCCRKDPSPTPWTGRCLQFHRWQAWPRQRASSMAVGLSPPPQKHLPSEHGPKPFLSRDMSWELSLSLLRMFDAMQCESYDSIPIASIEFNSIESNPI